MSGQKGGVVAEMKVALSLRGCTKGSSTITVRATSIKEALDCAVREYPKLRPQIYDQSGNLRGFVALFLNGENVDMLQDLLSPIQSDDVIEILLAVSGGSAVVARRDIQS